MTTQIDAPIRLEAPPDVAAVILLAGRVGADPFARGVERSTLDLPVDAATTVFDLWRDRLSGFAGGARRAPLRVFVSIAVDGPAPRERPRRDAPRVRFTIVRDRAAYRGPAGAVRDLTRRFRGDDRVLVLAASQVPLEPLSELAHALDRTGEGVSVTDVSGNDLSTAFLLRCGRLRDVPDVGFIDLKEQAIPSERGFAPLGVARRRPGAALPFRTLDDYIRTLRVLHGGADAARALDDPFAETWRPTFAVVEPGAEVAPDAVLHDAVVLAGGRVGAGAVVARSVVGPRGVVARGARVVDSVVAGDS